MWLVVVMLRSVARIENSTVGLSLSINTASILNSGNAPRELSVCLQSFLFWEQLIKNTFLA